MVKKCEKCNRNLPTDCSPSVYACTANYGCNQKTVAEKYKDKDGDCGLQIDCERDAFGQTWRKIKYKNGKTSWMPDSFLTKLKI